jgi:anhydro-N-acetylmuramic acid kinase
MTKTYNSIGLMSGTSMDGIDLAFIESDGKELIKRKKFTYKSYDKDFKKRLASLIYNTPTLVEIKQIENELTLLHAELVNDFLHQNKINRRTIDLIAFHGHTILHIPQQQITWQIGNPQLLAHKTGINVIADFRMKDIVLGGQGAPLVPIYHFYLLHNKIRRRAILNIGGISNITYFPGDSENDIEAFDICFGNAPFDDLMKEKFGRDFDQNGELAKSGNVDFILADRILQNEIFHKKPPKSFSRDDFSTLLSPINSLKAEDALATFSYMHAKAIQINLGFLSHKPQELVVCGGGRKNAAIMDEIKKWLSGIEIKTAEEVGLNGDAVESEAFAFLGIRSLLNLPISFQRTTGVYGQGSEEVLTPDSSIISEKLEEGLVPAVQRNSACGGVLYRA